jgi:hypothetical protein
MKRRLAAAVLALVAFGALAGSTSARVVTETEVTIKPFLPLYHGKVKSDFKQCVRHRKVILKRVQPGRDEKIGTDRAYRRVKWQVDAPVDLAPGDKFYALTRNVEVSSTGTGLSCAGDKSKVIEFVGG